MVHPDMSSWIVYYMWVVGFFAGWAWSNAYRSYQNWKKTQHD
jgi:hypothetical protein